jgi:hypothetical protein
LGILPRYRPSPSCKTLCVILAERNEKLKLIQMNKLKLAYFLLIASSILLIINILNFDFNNLQNGNYWGIVSNLLLMFGMIVNIRDLKNR